MGLLGSVPTRPLRERVLGLQMLWDLIVDVPQSATEAAMRAGLSAEAAGAMFPDMREEAFELMAFRLDDAQVVGAIDRGVTRAEYFTKADRGRFPRARLVAARIEGASKRSLVPHQSITVNREGGGWSSID